MKTPCDACPFLNENKDMLTHSRRRGISDSIHRDGDFPGSNLKRDTYLL
jgi:hypothetical protein